MKTYTLTRIHDPLNRTDKDVAAYEYRGEPLSVIAARELPPDIEFVISIGGRIIPTDRLYEVIPEAGDFVTCLPILAGSDGKQIGRIVAMIAIAALSGGIGAIADAGFLGASSAALAVAQGGIAGIMTGVGIMVAGGLLVNAILPAARPSIPSIGSDYGKSQLYGWSPQTIQQQGGAIPEWFGRNKLYGNIISSYIDTDGDQTFLNVLISLGYGPFADIPAGTMMINDQPLTNFNGVNPQVQLGHLNQSAFSQFFTTRIDTPQSRKVTAAAPVVYTTPAANFDVLEIELSFPSGLYSINDSGGYDAVTVEARVEISSHGAGQWRAITQSADNYGTLNLSRWSAGYWMTGTKNIYNPGFGLPIPAQVKLWFEVTAGETYYSRSVEEPYPGGEGGYYFTDTPWHVEGDPVVGHPEAQWHWFDGTQPVNVVNAAVDYFDTTGNAAKTVRRIIKAAGLVHGQYDIRITRISADSTDTRIQSDLYLTKVTTAIADAQEYPREVLVALHALGTDQLSGSLRFSVVADCKLIRVHDGTAWSVRFNTNPAWVIWHIFTRPVFNNDLTVARYDGYDPAKLDLPKFLELANRCDTQVPDGNGGTEALFRFDGGFDSDGNVWTAAMQVAEECGAVPFWNGFKITLAIDQPTTPEAGFNMGNITEGSYEETWLPIADRATEIEVTFRDQAADYQQTPYTVMDPDTPAVTPNKTQRQAVGITRSSGAWRYGLYKVKCNQILLCGIKFQVDVESIACTLGDCFHFSNDWPQWGFSGRTVSSTSGSITLDREVDVAAGKTYQVLVIHPDGSSSTRSVSNVPGAYSTLTVATPFTLLPALHDLYFFGETELVAKPFVISKIEPFGDLHATIYAIEYNATLQGVYTGAPVLPSPNYSALEPFPPVTALTAYELITKRQDGTIDDFVIGSFDVPRSSSFAKAQIWVSANGGGWVHVADSLDGNFQFPAQPGIDYTIAAVTVNAAGQTMPLGNAPLKSVHTEGKEAPPADVTGLGLAITRGELLITWDAVPDIDVAGYTLQIGTVWDAADNTDVVKDFGGTSYPWTLQHSGTINILIKAKDSSGHYSVTAASASITIPAPDTPTAISCTAQFLAIDLAIAYDTTRQDTAYVEICAQTANNRPATPTIVGITKTGRYQHQGLDNGDIRYYWARAVNIFGEEGAWYPSSATAGVAGMTLTDPSSMLKLLNNQIDDAILLQYLQGQINLIPAIDTGNTVATPGVANPGLFTNWTQTILGANSKAHNTQADVLAATTAISELQGEIQLLATASTIEGLTTRVSAAEIDINALDAAILLKASQTSVNGLATQMTAVEIDLDAMSGAITLKAAQTSVDTLSGAVSTQGSQLDVVKDRITLKTQSQGYVAGMVMGWGQPDKSEIVFLSNVYKICQPDGTGVKQAFTVGTVAGQTTVGVAGNMVLDGSILARMIAADQLVVGDNVTMGANAYITWANVNNKPTIPTNTNQLADGAGLGQTAAWSGVSNKPTIPTNTNQLTDGAGLGQTAAWSGVSNKPTIPTNTNQLTDGAGLGQTAAWSGVSGRPNTTYIDQYGVYTGTLTAAQVNAVAISAGSVTSGTFTGLVFRTALDSSNEQIKIDSASNRIYFTGLNRASGGTKIALATIGKASSSGYATRLAIISSGDDATGVTYNIGGITVDSSAASDLIGLYGKSVLECGVLGTSIAAPGVQGLSDQYGVVGRGYLGGVCGVGLHPAEAGYYPAPDFIAAGSGLMQFVVTEYPNKLPTPASLSPGTIAVYKSSNGGHELTILTTYGGATHWRRVDDFLHSEGCPTA